MVFSLTSGEVGRSSSRENKQGQTSMVELAGGDPSVPTGDSTHPMELSGQMGRTVECQAGPRVLLENDSVDSKGQRENEIDTQVGGGKGGQNHLLRGTGSSH